jgi:hypothetical protein
MPKSVSSPVYAIPPAAPQTRRAALRALAGVPALVALPAASVVATLPMAGVAANAMMAAPAGDDPDAELFVLSHKLDGLWQIYEAATAEWLRLTEDLNARRPAALKFLSTDTVYFEGTVDQAPGQIWYAPYQVIALRRAPRMKLDFLGTDAERSTLSIEETRKRRLWAVVPDPVAQARADEIIAAFDGWELGRDSHRSEIGLDAAEQRGKDLGNACSDLYESILNIEPKTRRGLAVLAAAMRRNNDEEYSGGIILDGVLRLAAATATGAASG